MTALSTRTSLVSGVNNTNAEIGLLAMYDAINEATEKPELDIASASTCDIGAMASTKLRITGTTTITSLGTVYRGPIILRMAAALTITYNATTLVCPGNVSLVTAAGDVLIAWPKTTTAGTSNGWQVVMLSRASATIGMQSPGSVAITGGSITGITDLAIADGGTGASSAAAAFAALKQAATESVSGAVELADYIEGTGYTLSPSATVACTPASLAAVRAFSSNGYQRFPGGLLLQWARSSNLGDWGGGTITTDITFPIAFPNAVLLVAPTFSVSGGNAPNGMAFWDIAGTSLSTARIKYVEFSSWVQTSNNYVQFFAIGY